MPAVYSVRRQGEGKEIGVNDRYAIELVDVEKRFAKKRGEQVTALAGISLQVGRGEVVGILGPNGSGKSTLVRVLSTLILPDKGEARIFGVDAVRHQRAAQRMMNRVSVEASFFKKLSAWENLLYSSKFYGVTSAEAKPKIASILSGMGFDMKRSSEPMEHLSRGMQQKIALARALLTSPMLMLLDEPTTGLDPRSKKDVQAVVRSIREEHDASILLCTHDMDEAEELCDRVGIMVNGRIVELDEPHALKRRYQTDGNLPNLEEVFMAATGSSFEEADVDEEVAA
jgi:ABC-2 type transport system ATP-binding protein